MRSAGGAGADATDVGRTAGVGCGAGYDVGDFGDALEVFRANRRIWETRQAPATRLRDARVGTTVKVVGTIDAEPSLRAALTLERCVAYRIRCGERRGDLGLDQFFASGGEHGAIVVIDEDGARVRLGEGETLLGASFVDVGDAARVDDDNDVLLRVIGRRLAARVLEVARRRTGLFFEDRLHAGDRVIARGLLEETTEIVASGYRDTVGRVLRLRALPDQPIVVCRP